MVLNSHIVFRAAKYLRLSKEDGDSSFSAKKHESDSISSQRDLIERYVEGCPDIELVAEFVDDGYTGTNFERPDFQKMIAAVERGEINCIIVKDLSRFGREYIDAGQFIEKYFPQKQIRFIAINDHYDSLTSNSVSDGMIVPFKNLINDSYSRDISIKVRSNLEAKRQRGEFIANFAVYGYQRDPDNKNHLLVDEEAAVVVRNIFQWKMEGLSPVKIAAKLNSLGVLGPAAYKKSKGSKYSTGFQSKLQAEWCPAAVARILTNETYCGVLIQGRRTTANYKVKKVVHKAEHEWARIEGTHEAIINHTQFNIVQRLMEEDCRSLHGKDTVHPLSGRVFCGDCGTLAKRKVVCNGDKKYAYYCCPNSGKGRPCSPKNISEGTLETTVLTILQSEIEAVLNMGEILAQRDASAWEMREMRRLDASITVQEDAIKSNNNLKVSAYEDYRDGLISRDELAGIKEYLSQRTTQAEECIRNLRVRKAELQGGISDQNGWLAQFRQYQNISELSRVVVVNLIDRILLFPGKKVQIVLHHEDQIRQIAEYLRTQDALPIGGLKEVG